MGRKFAKLFLKHKYNWKMYLRLALAPLMITFVIVGAFCEFGFDLMNKHLPKVE